MAVSIISNGSLITDRWMQTYGRYVDMLGVSIDSFVPETNEAIGRGNLPASRILQIREWCTEQHIKFKLNTVVCCFNWQEDMNEQIRNLDPFRWKVFQALVLRGENSGGVGELRDGRPLIVNKKEYWTFVNHHKSAFPDILVPEPNEVMQNSYLLLDENMSFLDSSTGGKIPSASILNVGVKEALMQSGFDQTMFDQRGGVYDWSRTK